MENKMESHKSRLIFLRHGPSVNGEDFQGDDSGRPLTSRGVRSVYRVGKALSKRYRPDLVITSDYLRAKQTAKICRKRLKHSLKHKIKLIETPHLRPNAQWNEWETWIKDFNDTTKKTDTTQDQSNPDDIERTWLIVGHEPSMSQFVSKYLKVDPQCLNLEKSGVTIIEKNNHDNLWFLAAVVPPKLWRKKRMMP